MTFIGTSPVCFGKYYIWFKQYWHYEREREINYSSFDVFIRTEAIFYVSNKNGIRISGKLKN